MAIIHGFVTSTYARNIYLLGASSFTKIQNEQPQYIEPVKQFAAQNYTDDQIKRALDNDWINQQQYDDTMTYKYPTLSE